MSSLSPPVITIVTGASIVIDVPPPSAAGTYRIAARGDQLPLEGICAAGGSGGGSLQISGGLLLEDLHLLLAIA